MQTVFKRKVLQDIPELVESLRDQQSRTRDLLVPLDRMWMTEEQDEERSSLRTRMFIATKKASMNYPLLTWAHRQLATKTGIPRQYYEKCHVQDPELLSVNVNTWLKRLYNDRKAVDKSTKVLIRLIDNKVRAILSDRYKIVDHLDLVTSAVQVVTGTDGPQENVGARGARCFVWQLDDLKLDLGFVNPGMVVDLEALDAGVQNGMITEGEGGGTAFAYPGSVHQHDQTVYDWGNRPEPPEGSHFVFPAAFIRNHEGGGGSAIVEVGIYEAICDNTCRIGTSLIRRHIGSQLSASDLDSDTTRRKQSDLIFSQFGDVLRQAFDSQRFLALCKKFKGLEDKSVEDVENTVKHLIKLHGLTEDLRDDILMAYTPAKPGKNTMLDVQRAFTNAAHRVRETNYDTAVDLEKVGGKLIAV